MFNAGTRRPEMKTTKKVKATKVKDLSTKPAKGVMGGLNFTKITY
jgi:hypothetical protein